VAAGFSGALAARWLMLVARSSRPVPLDAAARVDHFEAGVLIRQAIGGSKRWPTSACDPRRIQSLPARLLQGRPPLAYMLMRQERAGAARRV
jgi:hypothetical protein